MVALLFPLAPVLGPVLAAIVAAVLLLMLFLSIWILLKPISIAVGYIPVVGHAAAEGVNNAATAVTNWVSGWVDGAVWPLIRLVMAPVQAIHGFAVATVGGIEYVMDQTRILSLAVAGRVGVMARQLSSVVGNLNALTLRVAAALLSAATALALGRAIRSVDVPAARSEAIAASNAYTSGRVASEAGARSVAVAAAVATAAAALSAERQARLQGDAATKAAAAAAAAALSVAITALRDHVRTETDVRVGTLANELTQVKTKAIPDALAKALAATAVVAEALRLAKQCLDPLCKGSTRSTLDMFGALGAGAELLLLLELVGAAVHDPQGSAKAVASGADTLHGIGSTLLSPFIGQA